MAGPALVASASSGAAPRRGGAGTTEAGQTPARRLPVDAASAVAASAPFFSERPGVRPGAA